jgi:hypothetical protein
MFWHNSDFFYSKPKNGRWHTNDLFIGCALCLQTDITKGAVIFSNEQESNAPMKAIFVVFYCAPEWLICMFFFHDI